MTLFDMFQYIDSPAKSVTTNENCFEANALNGLVYLKRCKEDSHQKWKYNEQNMTLTNELTNACLDIVRSQTTFELILNRCNGELSQKWLLQDNFDWQSLTHNSV